MIGSRLSILVTFAWANSLLLTVAGGIWILNASREVIRPLVVDLSSVTALTIDAVGVAMIVISTLGLFALVSFRLVPFVAMASS